MTEDGLDMLTNLMTSTNPPKIIFCFTLPLSGLNEMTKVSKKFLILAATFFICKGSSGKFLSS